MIGTFGKPSYKTCLTTATLVLACCQHVRGGHQIGIQFLAASKRQQTKFCLRLFEMRRRFLRVLLPLLIIVPQCFSEAQQRQQETNLGGERQKRKIVISDTNGYCPIFVVQYF
jgi:hypothetical protein